MTAEAPRAENKASDADLLGAVAHEPPPSYDASLRFNLAGILHLSERLVNRVVTGYESVFKLEQVDQVEILLSMATSYVRNGQTDQAVDSLRRVLSLQPDNALAWFQLGVLRLHGESTVAAVEALEHAKGLGMESYELRAYLADALSDLDRHAEAIEELNRALELRPDSAECHYCLGVALDKEGRFEEAVAAFRKSVELAPRETCYHQSLGFALESLGDREAAMECFKQAVSLERRAVR